MSLPTYRCGGCVLPPPSRSDLRVVAAPGTAVRAPGVVVGRPNVRVRHRGPRRTVAGPTGTVPLMPDARTAP